MSDYKPGSMDITEQEKTFHGFLKVAAATAIIVLLILAFLAVVGT